MIKKILVTLLLITYIFGFVPVNATSVNTASSISVEDYATLRDIDKATFNEYRYRIVNEYFTFKKLYELKSSIDTTSANSMMNYAKLGYNYLPDTLINKNLLNNFVIALQRGITAPNSEVYYQDIIASMDKYIKEVRTNKITGSISASPSTGNAPLNTTFRGDVSDPTGTIIPSANYIWWVDVAGVKKVIGRGITLNYTFREEGNYTIFLDVKSNHKNSLGNTDVLPFSSRYVVNVKSKIASIILKVNSNYLRDSDELKFTPDEASYGLIFDATASTPTGGAKFSRTEWDFGNGIVRKYNGEPKLERVVYSKEGNFTVELKLTTNEGKYIERSFIVYIHKPIATISSNVDNGFIGDKFSFSAKPGVNEKNLTYSWNIINLSNDSIVLKKDGNILEHTFSEKGRYTIQLHVKDAAGNDDVDTKTVYVNSRAPIANFTSSMPFAAKPNKVLLDGTKSYDQDVSDQGKLTYEWTIDGEKVELDNLDSKGAIGYYTFDSIGDHNVSLEVTDTDNMNSVFSSKVKITSNLSVDFYPFPKVVQRGSTVRFVVTSPKAKSFEWDFGDGTKKTTTNPVMQYNYKNSGTYTVLLTVRDIDGNSNKMSKTVYVGDSNNPVAVIGLTQGDASTPNFDNSACMNGAYTVDRVTSVSFRGDESVNTDGKVNGLSYTWKIGNNKILSGKSTTYKFDELGCFPIKLTVKSDTKGTSSTDEVWVKVENIKPALSGVLVQPVNIDSDPVVVNLQALGATDKDGVIQSYLWYYYTDTDPEPQDYRITTLPNTSFVLPKITGNYYFVVVMKDNNDERYSSLDGDSSKYFISLTGDNINTPLIDFKVNKNSLIVGEEALFNATVKNVLGNDISSKVEYTWDFDGDGFYDKETNVGSISYNYKTSGTFYAKVRAKYKGMTNVRTIEVNVSNILKPDFDYISVGNKYLIFNTSKGKSDSVVFDMGDGNKVTDKNYFEYVYEDGQKLHNVVLKISEGTKVKDISKDVSIDMKSFINSKAGSGIMLYSNPSISGNSISLLEKKDTVVVYIPVNNSSIKNIAVDSDIDTDSDLNGTNDDDIDNKNTGSYTQGGFFEIPVNDRKNQVFRVSYYDENQKVIDSKDIAISKDYIEEKDVDVNSIVFNGVSEAEKIKIEKLKSFVTALPKETRLKGMNFIQKLQEEWFYETEKTKVILDFEKYIDSLKLTNGQEIIELLESLLVQGQEDQSVRNMAYNVVKNLIPKSIVNYAEIIKDIDTIKENPSKIEENKVLGKSILEEIKDTSLIEAEDKVTIKTQLQVLIYGSIDKIPQELKDNVKVESTDSGTGKVLGLFVTIIKIIMYLFILLILVILGFFIWYKVSNKNENLGFQDFIIEKTSGKGNSGDVLGDVLDISKTQENNSIIRKTQQENQISTPKNEEKSEVKDENIVPDWLKKSSGNDNLNKTLKNDKKVKEAEVKAEPKTETEASVPDWLKGTSVETKEEPKVEEVELKTKVISNNFDLEKVDSLDSDVPDWLKESSKEGNTKKQKSKEPEVPDWLKGVSLEKEVIQEPEIKEVSEINSLQKEEEGVKKPQKKLKEKQPENLVSQNEKSENKKPKAQKPAQTKTEKKEESNVNKTNDELWSDGMVIPDWLKTDDSKK